MYIKLFQGIIFSTLIASKVNAAAYVLPEAPTAVNLSNTDVNRIHCQGPVKDVLVSEEKGVITKVVGNDLFIKYKVMITPDGKERYTTKTNDAYVICAGATYSLVINPKPITGQTIILKGPAKNIAKNEKLFRGKDIEEMYSFILKAIYKDDLPESFSVKDSDGSILHPYFKNLDIRQRRSIRIEGEGLSVNEFIVTAKSTVNLIEQDFLIEGFVKKPVFIAIEPRNLKKGNQARLFIIEKVNEEL